jgi:hypothetical protein
MMLPTACPALTKKKFKWTKQDMESIASFNKIVRNYLKMQEIL